MSEKEVEVESAEKKSSCSLSDYNSLVLSGGAVRGLTILGALQYAYDNFLLKNVKFFFGTSVGAIICYLLVIGYTPIEMIVYLCTNQLMEKMQSFNIVAMIQGRGASSFNYLTEHLEKMTIAKIGFLPTMEDLYTKYGKTLVCTTHNITESRTEYIRYETHPKVPCLTAIRMSANLPLVFERFKYGHSIYVDGGISDNFPIQMADKPGNKVLGILLSKGKSALEKNVELNTLEYIYKLLFIPIRQSVQYKINNASSERCKIVHLQSVEEIKFFNFNVPSHVKLNMFSKGYEQMQKIFE